MEVHEAIQLIGGAVDPKAGSCWADLGCGTGLFTNALSTLIGERSTLYAVDRDEHALSNVSVASHAKLVLIRGDFSRDEFGFPPLDGILMANSLHFLHDHTSFIRKLKSWLAPTGRIILVEYDTSRSSPWIPYPIPFSDLDKKFETEGFECRRLADRPSKFGSARIYSALLSLPV